MQLERTQSTFQYWFSFHGIFKRFAIQKNHFKLSKGLLSFLPFFLSKKWTLLSFESSNLTRQFFFYYVEKLIKHNTFKENCNTTAHSTLFLLNFKGITNYSTKSMKQHFVYSQHTSQLQTVKRDF